MIAPVFAVFAKAGYRHLCMGMFGSLEEAEKCAVEASTVEADSHHAFQITRFVLGESLVRTTPIDEGDKCSHLRACAEPPPIKTYVRSQSWDPIEKKLNVGPWVWEDGGERCCEGHNYGPTS
jgi:hypothetical protein